MISYPGVMKNKEIFLEGPKPKSVYFLGIKNIFNQIVIEHAAKCVSTLVGSSTLVRLIVIFEIVYFSNFVNHCCSCHLLL